MVCLDGEGSGSEVSPGPLEAGGVSAAYQCPGAMGNQTLIYWMEHLRGRPGQDLIGQCHSDCQCQSPGQDKELSRGTGGLTHSSVGGTSHAGSLRQLHSGHGKLSGRVPRLSNAGSRDPLADVTDDLVGVLTILFTSFPLSSFSLLCCAG